LLVWIADVDQEAISSQPDGERFHVHLSGKDAPGFASLTPFSANTELCRLDAKGTGELPEKYRRPGPKRAMKKSSKPAVKSATTKRTAGKRNKSAKKPRTNER